MQLIHIQNLVNSRVKVNVSSRVKVDNYHSSAITDYFSSSRFKRFLKTKEDVGNLLNLFCFKKSKTTEDLSSFFSFFWG